MKEGKGEQSGGFGSSSRTRWSGTPALPPFSPEFRSSEFRVLDRALSGGWPKGVLTELLIDTYGIGELAMLMPALAAICDPHRGEGAGGWIMWVSPPYIPYVPALRYHGIDITRLLLVHPGSHIDALWAMEQSLQSGTCAAVLGWSSVSDSRALRRLQLAAEKHNGWAVLFRPTRFRHHGSPAALRIHVRAGPSGHTHLAILKNHGGPPATVELTR